MTACKPSSTPMVKNVKTMLEDDPKCIQHKRLQKNDWEAPLSHQHYVGHHVCCHLSELVPVETYETSSPSHTQDLTLS